MASAGFRRAFEDLVAGRRPAWRHLARDRLVGACVEWLAPERVCAPAGLDGSASRVIWVLDRLLPLEETATFRRVHEWEPWMESAYALFRRAPVEMESVTPQRFDAGERCAVAAAWAETRRSDDELLSWSGECRRRGWSPRPYDDPTALAEYCRRAPDRARLVGHVAVAGPEESRLLHYHLVRSLASDLPRTEAPEAGLLPRLRRAGLDALADSIEAAERRAVGSISATLGKLGLPAPSPRFEDSRLAELVWVEQQTLADADRLLASPSAHVAARLARIAPPDRVDLWDRAFASHPPRRDPVAHDRFVRAFCGWCPPRHRALLLRHLDAHDLDWASCALEAYLALAAPDEVEALARRGKGPSRHAAFIERWRDAIPELRPPRRDPLPWPGRGFDLRQFDLLGAVQNGAPSG